MLLYSNPAETFGKHMVISHKRPVKTEKRKTSCLKEKGFIIKYYAWLTFNHGVQISNLPFMIIIIITFPQKTPKTFIIFKSFYRQ